jgi:antitoxin PrlF
LANDIQNNPQHLKVVTPELVSRIQNLIGDIDIDLDAPLDDEEDE